MTRDQAIAVLGHIDTADDCTVQQLAADTGYARTTVSRILDRLCEQGLVESQVRDGVECWQLTEGIDPAALEWHETRKKLRELPVEPWMLAADLRRVDTLEAFDRLEQQLAAAREIAVDFETTGLDDALEPLGDTVDKIVGICISHVSGQAFYVPVRHELGQNIPTRRADDLLRALHARAAAGGCIILFWNARFDLAFWRAIAGCNRWTPEMFRDGMLLSQHDFPADRHGLKEQAESKLGMRMYRLSQLSRERRPARQLPPDLEGLGDLTEYLRPDSTPEYSFAKLDPTRLEVLRYACGDALATFELARLGGPFEQTRIQRAGQIKLDQLLIPILTRWERQLIGIDRKLALSKLTAAWAQRQKVDRALRQWAAARGCEHPHLTTSTVAISDFLFGSLEIKPPKRPTDAARAKHEKKGAPLRYPTDEGALAKLAGHEVAGPFCRALLELRKLDKEIGTYLSSFVCNAHGRQGDELRANIRLNGAATTGRFSSPMVEGRGVPFHGIPRPSPTSKGHRDLVVARSSFELLKVDYAGQELRIIANLSGDPAMLALFDRDAPCDPHTATARILFANDKLTKADKYERDIAKRVGFAIHYGAGPAVVQREITCTLAEATAFVQRMRAARPVAFAWAASLSEQSRTCGFIRTGFDRIIDTRCYEWRYEFDAMAGGNVRRRALVHNVDDACNYTVQGTGADVLKLAKLKLERWIVHEVGVDVVRPLLSVHDEILFEVRSSRLQELQPEIIRIMESVSPAHWRIPLVCEAQTGPTWAGE